MLSRELEQATGSVRNASFLAEWVDGGGGGGGGGGDGTCSYALAAVCGQPTEHTASSATMKCDACVGGHAVALRGAGCSARDVQVWCTGQRANTGNSGGSNSSALGRFKTDDNVTAPFSIFWLLGDRKWEPPPYDVTQYGFNENGTMILDVFGEQPVWPDIRGHDRAFNFQLTTCVFLPVPVTSVLTMSFWVPCISSFSCCFVTTRITQHVRTCLS